MNKTFFNSKKEKSSLRWFLFFISFIFMIGFVASVPPVTQVSQFAETIEITYPQYDYVPQNAAFQLNVRIINGSSQLTNVTASCDLHLLNPDGTHTMESFMDFEDDEFYIDISSGNFTDLGFHGFVIMCNTSNQVGFANGVFEVTRSGQESNPNFFWFILLISAGIIGLGFAIKNAPITILGSFGLVYVGLYIILNGINGLKDTVYTWGWGVIILAVAGYIGIKSAYEMIQDSAE